MSNITRRTSRRSINRANLHRALHRLFADITTLIDIADGNMLAIESVKALTRRDAIGLMQRIDLLYSKGDGKDPRLELKVAKWQPRRPT